MTQRRPRFVWVVAPFGIVLALMVLFGRAAVFATTPAQQQIQGAQAVAQARQSSSETVIATVGNQPITDADFRQAEATVQDNLTYMAARISANGPDAPQLQAFVTLIDQSGVANAGLGSLIARQAPYEDAVAKGYQPAPGEVTARVNQDKATVAQGKAPALAAYVAVVGPSYWTSTYPQLVREQLAINKLRSATVAGVAQANQAKAWDALSWQVVQQTPATLEQPAAVAPATVSAALRYLAAYYAGGFGG